MRWDCCDYRCDLEKHKLSMDSGGGVSLYKGRPSQCMDHGHEDLLTSWCPQGNSAVRVSALGVGTREVLAEDVPF